MNRRQFIGCGGFAAMQAPSQAAGFTAGFAETDITPRIGMEMAGGYVKAFQRKFHDPCKVRAAVFGDGADRAALVSVDALIVPRPVAQAVRAAVQQRCGLAPDCVMIGATHSHSSGPVAMVQPGEYDHAPAFVRKLAYDLTSCADAGYLDHVRAQAIEAVVRADAARRPVVCGVGRGREETVAFNRRFRMRNGQSWTHPGVGNPDIIEPAGPIDPEVGVVGAWDEQGRLAGAIVNFACHATTSPDGISANWIYYMEKIIRAVYGPDVIVMLMQGHCGDVTQVDNRSRYRTPTGDQYARLVGGRVGAEAVKVLTASHVGRLAPIRAASQTLTLPRRKPSPERVRRAAEIAAKDQKEVGHARWVFAKEIVLVDALIARYPTVEAEIQAVQLGPAVFLSSPGEMFVEWGLATKAKSKFPFTFPVELANGCVGYVPTEEALGARGGGYETRLTSYTNLQPDAGRRMLDTALGLAARLTPGAVPEPPAAPPFRGPWEYGNVGPELS